MATVTREAVVLPPTSSSQADVRESRNLLPNVSWDLYQRIVEARGERSVPRLGYLAGDLELMSPSYLHEALASWSDYFVAMVAGGLGRPCIPGRSTLWERAGLEVGKEPDACFYLANAPAVRGLTAIDLQIHPPPDLAIEVELSRPKVDILRIYSGLGVPEVWTTDGDALRFLHLGPDGMYTEHETSRNFPMLRAVETLEWIVRGTQADDLNQWMEEVKDWSRRVLATRQRPLP